jgi:antirestriction protein ArdC
MKKEDIYQKVTEKIIANLETAGSWEKLWNVPVPISLNKHIYHGINFLLLDGTKYQSNVWGTFNQVRENGGTVKKGESSQIVVFWKMLEIDTMNNKSNPQNVQGEAKRIPLLKYYNVFNADQCNFDDLGKKKVAGLESLSSSERKSKLVEAETLIEKMPNKPQIEEKTGDKAYYSPMEDLICVPYMKYFQTTDAFYRTLFHEIIHSTGHESRLKRFNHTERVSLDSESYSKEELLAELGSAYLSVLAGLGDNHENSVAYIKGWSQRLKDNTSWIVTAANLAQKAVDYITG